MLISVILPCYNVEKYIDRCLESIVNQTIGVENLEIICVDDCSSDGTLPKLKEWEKKYPENIIVITYEENQRQGGARNIGIQYSSCEWISFVDSDDWIELDMFEVLYEKAKTEKYDMVGCKYEEDSGRGFLRETLRYDKELIVNDGEKYHWWNLIDVGTNGTFGGPVAKLIKRSVLIDNDIWFPIHLAYEDNYWYNLLLIHICSIYIIDRSYYHYGTNNESTIMKKNALYHLDRLTVEEMLISKYVELGVFNKFYPEIFWGFLQRYYLGTLFIIFTRFDYYDAAIYQYIKKRIYELFPMVEIHIKQILKSDLDNKNKMLLEYLVGERDVDNQMFIDMRNQYMSEL